MNQLLCLWDLTADELATSSAGSLTYGSWQSVQRAQIIGR
jgi:hypothetical protein